MANKKVGNNWYIDSTGTLTSDKNQMIVYIIVTPTSGNAVLDLSDPGITGTPTIFSVRASTSGDSKQFSFERSPISFPNGIKVETLTNCTAQIVVTKQGA